MRKLIILATIMGFVPIQAKEQFGIASWYSVKCNGGTHTASGRKLKDDHYTIAHKTLPFGTLVKITNLNNGKEQIAKVSDRGPYIKGRIIDTTRIVAEKLEFKKRGLTRVKIEVIKLEPEKKKTAIESFKDFFKRTNNKIKYDPEQLKIGIAVEREHTLDDRVAEIIAKKHIEEDPAYYTKLKKAKL